MSSRSTPANVVRLLAAAGHPKPWLERKVAELGQGVTTALRDSTLRVEDAWDELFNLDNYQAIVAARLDKDLKELFEWGMELDTVARLAPDSLDESFNAMSQLARNVIVRSRRKQSGSRRRTAARAMRARA